MSLGGADGFSLCKKLCFCFRSKGFILEGFPRNADEVRYLAAAGYFPDGTIALSVKDSNIVERLMPPVLERWRKKRAKDLARRERKLNAQLKFRVSNSSISRSYTCV